MDISEILYNTTWIIIYVIVLILFLVVLIGNIGNIIRSNYEKKHAYNLTFLQVKVPKDTEVEIKAAEHMFSNLMGFKKSLWKSIFTGDYRVSFEIVSKKEGIGFYVVVPDDIVSIVEKQINGAYPDAEIDIINPHEVWDRGEYTQVVELALKNRSFYPLKVYEDQKNDTLSPITSAMSKMKDDEVVAVQYVIQPAPDIWRHIGYTFVSSVKARANNPDKKINVDTSFLENIEKKVAHNGFYTKVRIIAIAKTKIDAQTHVQNVMSAFEQFADPKNNKFVKRFSLLTRGQVIIDDFIYRRIRIKDWHIPIFNFQIYLNTPILNIVELATVFHFPNKNVQTPNIMWLAARRSAAPVNIPEEGLYLGKSSFRGVEKKIFMSAEDRARHFYIIGQTGTGKSVTMFELARQDIENGEGVAIFDPHGVDLNKLMEKIPRHRVDDVIYFDASDTEMPLGLNMLGANNEEEKHLIINSFIALLYKLYDPNHQGIMGPILERAIRNVMLTAMADPEATMVDVMRLLIDPKYVKKFQEKITDPMVQRYWEEVARTPESRKGETMGYFVSKFDRFVTDVTMRRILGQPKTVIDFDQIMAEKKILLVDLAKGKIGEENSNFLGLLMIPRILSAALRRQKLIGVQDFPPFYLYVDEFQNFATPDFATILSEARKYKLNLIIAHQFVEQLTEDIKSAVFGNVGTMAVFRVGAKDAEFLEGYFGPTFSEKDLANLSVGNCYMRLLVKGHPTPPFSMYVDWNDVNAVPKDKEVAQLIREMSRKKYGKPAAEVEAWINERAGFNEKEAEPEFSPERPRIPF